MKDGSGALCKKGIMPRITSSIHAGYIGAVRFLSALNSSSLISSCLKQFCYA